MPFPTIFTALFYPYIAHERTAQNLILSLRFALFVKERHGSQNEGSLKSKERFQRAMCPALINSVIMQGTWVWTDGSAWDYSNWWSGQPVGSTLANCAFLNFDQSWQDMLCDFSCYSICKLDKK